MEEGSKVRLSHPRTEHGASLVGEVKAIGEASAFVLWTAPDGKHRMPTWVGLDDLKEVS